MTTPQSPTAPGSAHSLHRRIEADPALLDDCVHCGFCLPTCPTYVLWGEEMDSPRGRIDLMRSATGGQLSATAAAHFDACLGCMGCVTACPSGVQYGKLIEATRVAVESDVRRGLGAKLLRGLVFALFPRPRRLRWLRPALRLYQFSRLPRLVRSLALLRRAAPSLMAMEELIPPLTRVTPIPEFLPGLGDRRGRIGMLTGCVQSEFFPDVNAATARVLAAEGFDVVVPRRQGCCGALSVHNGRHEEARTYAKRLLDTFRDADVDAVIVNAAGCGSSLKEYGELLADDPAYAALAAHFATRVRDVSEFLADTEPRATRHPLPVPVAYHDACHLAHAQGVRSQPRQLLRGIPGLALREIADGSLCCGSAGVYNILNPEPARELGDRKAANVAATGARLLVTANPGCLMHISASLRRRGTPLRAVHTIQVLDASINGRDPASLLGT